MSSQISIACDLSAIDREERPKHQQNGEQIFKAVESVRELSNGYAFKIPAETTLIEQAGAFIAWERLCCPFFHFTLEVTPGHNPVWLKLTGSEDVKQFVAHNILPQLKTGVNGD